MSFMSFSESLYDRVFSWASELVFCVVPRRSDEESYDLTYTLCTPLFAWFEYAFHHNRYLTSYSIYELSCIIPYTSELPNTSEQSATFYSLHVGLDEYRRILSNCTSLSEANTTIMLKIQQLLHCPPTAENKAAIQSCFQYHSSINVHFFTQDIIINFQLPPDLAPDVLAQINEAIANSEPSTTLPSIPNVPSGQTHIIAEKDKTLKDVLSFMDILKSILSSILGQIIFSSVRVVIFILIALLLYLLSSVPIVSNILNWFFASSKSTPTLATLYISTTLAYYLAKLAIQKLNGTTNRRRISLSLLGIFITSIHVLSLIANIFLQGGGDYRINIACIIAGLCFCLTNPDK